MRRNVVGCGLNRKHNANKELVLNNVSTADIYMVAPSKMDL